jgi:hypothetical protein
MSTVTIDNKDYVVEDMHEDAKAQLVSLQWVDGELAKLQAQLAAMQTARNAYAMALNELLSEKN